MNASTAVCVLGMSRTGTSLTTRILNLAGVYLGPDKGLLSGLPSNPDGHWENREMMHFNEWLLKSQGGDWRALPSLPVGWERSEELADERAMARGFLAETFAGHALWGWKDPRNCFTFPFWQRLVPGIRCVICIRNPIDVAASLAQRDEIEAEEAFELWHTYVRAALANTEGCSRIVVAYEDYFDDWRTPVALLARFVDRRLSSEGPDDFSRIEGAINESLRHHRTPVEVAFDDSRVPAEVASLYSAVTHAATAQPGRANLCFRSIRSL